MKWDYEEKVLINALGTKDQKSMANSHFPWSVYDVATIIIRELIIRCVFQMIQYHVNKVKSGLKNMIVVFIATTYDNHKNIVHKAFEMVEKIVQDYFLLCTEELATIDTGSAAYKILMELVLTIDAGRKALAKNITKIIPYFGYVETDRKTQRHESIAIKQVSNLIMEEGADRVLACDFHSGQSMDYFDISVDHVYCQHAILDYLVSKSICSNDLVMLSPDVGGVARASAFAKKLSDAPLAINRKKGCRRNVAEMMNLTGGNVFILGDMIDNVGTISKGTATKIWLGKEGTNSLAMEKQSMRTNAKFLEKFGVEGWYFQAVTVRRGKNQDEDEDEELKNLRIGNVEIADVACKADEEAVKMIMGAMEQMGGIYRVIVVVVADHGKAKGMKKKPLERIWVLCIIFYPP
ncbi:unnamed protein product [Lactuca saligna]|uniref:Ribose-phosphate diphosphokinase n=1 Tax=Lactuca saligna TaxID=75948 RepID=A0AA36EIV2_LACSI|nr:unnamed protein product [Lactuca saligna]